MFPGHRLVDVAQVGAGHIRVRAAAGDGARIAAIAFRAAAESLGQALMAGRGVLPIHLAGTLSVNRYGGRERAQLRVVDLAEAGR